MNVKARSLLVLFVLLVGSMPVAAIPGLSDIVDSVFAAITKVFNWFIEKQLAGVIIFLTWNPDINIVKPLTSDFIRLLTPLYIIAFLLVGIYFFFLSDSPKGRAKARSALLKLLLSMAFVISATTIYQFLLDLSEMLVNFVLDLMVVDISALGILLMAGMIGTAAPLFVIVYFSFLFTLLIVYGIRYLLLLIMAALFPLTIFFFYFEFTKDFGRKLMSYTLALIFTPVIQAIMLIFWVTTMNNVGTAATGAGDLAAFSIGIAGFFMMMLSPWITLKLLKWVGGLFAFAGFVFLGKQNMLAAMPLFLAGGLMMGEGPGAIPLAATFFFVHGLEHASEHKAEHRMYRAKGKAKARERREKGRRGRGGSEGPPEPPEGKPVWRRGPKAGEGPRTAPDWVNRRGMSSPELVRAGDELLSVGRDAAAKGHKTEAIGSLEKAARRYERSISRRTTLSRPERADVLAKLGEVYSELYNLAPSDAYSRSALSNYSNAVTRYGRLARRPGLSSAEVAEYTLKANECSKRAAEIRYRRG